jgi:hypothetical protein
MMVKFLYALGRDKDSHTVARCQTNGAQAYKTV